MPSKSCVKHMIVKEGPETEEPEGPWGHKELDMIEGLSTHTHSHAHIYMFLK